MNALSEQLVLQQGRTYCLGREAEPVVILISSRVLEQNKAWWASGTLNWAFFEQPAGLAPTVFKTKFWTPPQRSSPWSLSLPNRLFQEHFLQYGVVLLVLVFVTIIYLPRPPNNAPN